mmetsp:Transcript_134296/g.299405  ORF Transcript_134296/g.299405 Transcript_134296/m.299405 type:complete len:371 (+) Transcript_134296:292-1404(+)
MGTTSASATRTRRPCRGAADPEHATGKVVPGHPTKPRTLSRICNAVSLCGHSRPSSFLISGALVTSSSCCTSAVAMVMSPRNTFGRASSTRRFTPHLKRNFRSSSDVSVPLRDMDRCITSGPASILATVYKIVMPVSVSPASSARCTGEAPRQRGNSDGCRFRVPRRGARRKRPGKYCPYAAVTQTAGSKPSKSTRNSSSLAESGVQIRGTPSSSASSCTGVFEGSLFLPTLFGGCVTTAQSSKGAAGEEAVSQSVRRTEQTQSGEPKKTTRGGATPSLPAAPDASAACRGLRLPGPVRARATGAWKAGHLRSSFCGPPWRAARDVKEGAPVPTSAAQAATTKPASTVAATVRATGRRENARRGLHRKSA